MDNLLNQQNVAIKTEFPSSSDYLVNSGGGQQDLNELPEQGNENPLTNSWTPIEIQNDAIINIVSLKTKKGRGRPRKSRSVDGSQMICNLCYYKAHDAYDLEEHMKSHNIMFECNFCDSTFSEKVNLMTHIRRHVKEQSKCTNIASDQDSNQLPREAMETVEPIGVKKKRGRPRKTVEPVGVKKKRGRPRKTVDPIGVKKKRGRPRKAVEPIGIKKRRGRPRKTDSTNRGQSACSLCCYKPHDAYDLEEHMKSHKILLECNFCDSVLSEKVNLMTHIRRHVKEESKCTNIASDQDSNQLPREAMGTVEPIGVKKKRGRPRKTVITNRGQSACSLCCYKTHDAYDLEEHMKSHKILLECNFCDSLLSEKVNLMTHIRRHVNEESKCTNIASDQDSNQLPREAMGTVEPIGVKKKRGRPRKTYITNIGQIACSLCCYKTHDAYDLEEHMKSHKTMFECNYCDSVFSEKVNLMTHTRRHVKDDPKTKNNPRLVTSTPDTNNIPTKAEFPPTSGYLATNIACHQDSNKLLKEAKVILENETFSIMKKRGRPSKMNNTNEAQVVCNLCYYKAHGALDFEEHMKSHLRKYQWPTILFKRLRGKTKEFYACSACRDRKDCNFFIPASDLAKNSTRELSQHWKNQQKIILTTINNENRHETYLKMLEMTNTKSHSKNRTKTKSSKSNAAVTLNYNFYNKDQFIWFNMFNNHVFDEAQEKYLQDYLSTEKIIILLDPPFGGRVEPLAHTIKSLSKHLSKDRDVTFGRFFNPQLFEYF
ncbi:hypothetical protein RUM43_013172 [Polyplax serrata]|uniref:C2H2-type domain-containing protein n=1 Tax=Polyplax serrata TaxID=468196 RepID=A0AAN8PTD7_POLSC